MTNHQQNLIEYVSQCVSLVRRLDKKKLSAQAAKLAFQQLDKKRKGYLDLADVYELCGEVSEDELFVVFKWLDCQKKGDVTEEGFCQRIGEAAEWKDSEGDLVGKVKEIVVAYLQNYDYAKNLKTKLNLTEQTIAGVYQSLCQQKRKTSLVVNDLLESFSQSKKWDSLCQQQIKNMFRSVGNISEKSFVEAFDWASQSSEAQPVLVSPQNVPPTSVAYDQEQLLESINAEYATQKQARNVDQTRNVQANVFVRQNNAKDYQQERLNRYTQGIKPQISKQAEQSKGTQIDSLLNNIQKRREQLKKGSLQRQKLIEEALSRKRSNLPTSTNCNDIQQPYYEQSRQYSRPLSTPKASTYSQVCVNNYVDLNQRNDFGKIFNRYKQQKETCVDLEDRFGKRYETFEARDRRQWATGKNEWSDEGSPKMMEKAYSTAQNGFWKPDLNLPASQWKQTLSRNTQNLTLDTPKFSQTAQQRFFERPCSTGKVDRISQIRQKINHLPERRVQNQKDSRDIDMIIEKYRHMKVEHRVPSARVSDEDQWRSQPSDQQLIKNYATLNVRTRPQLAQFSAFQPNQFTLNVPSQSRYPPESYIQDPKSRLNGSIAQFKSGSIQKQNLLKRAEQQAARKIQQIQRRAKLKVLERKSAVGLKWVK